MVSNTLYKTEISDVRWMAYDIPGNVGWIAYLVCVFRALREKRDAYNVASALPGVFMLIGVGELISERIEGLDRILSGKRLYHSYAMMLLVEDAQEGCRHFVEYIKE